MQTFTTVGSRAFPGTLVREQRTHPVYGWGFFSYLSANLGERWMHVEKWDQDEASAPSENELRAVLRDAIEARGY